MNENIVFVICGPSGVGKGSIIRKVLGNDNNQVRLCRNLTDRLPRVGEVEGEEYFFTNEISISELYNQRALIGGAIRQYGFLYAIRIGEIENIWESGYNVIVEANFERIKQIREHFKNVVVIFIAPPSISVLIDRLNQRNRDTNSEEKALRISESQQMLKDVNPQIVDYYIVNVDLQDSSNKVQMIIQAEYSRLRDR